jgi:hypothetical protein
MTAVPALRASALRVTQSRNERESTQLDVVVVGIGVCVIVAALE